MPADDVEFPRCADHTVRLQHVEDAVARLADDQKALRSEFSAFDVRSAERHGVTQAQGATILGKLGEVDRRLNAPSVGTIVASLCGTPKALATSAGAIAVLLGAIGTLAISLGYAATPAPEQRDVIVRVPVDERGEPPAPAPAP